MTHPAAAVTALALAGALVLGAAAGSGVLLLAVLLAQFLVVTSWHRSVGEPGAAGGALVAGAACVGADVLVVVEEGDRPLGPVAPVLALAVIGALVHQIARRDRSRLLASMSATLTVTAFAGLACAYLAVVKSDGGAPLVAAAAVPAGLVAAGLVVRRRRGAPSRVDLAVAVVAALAALVVAPTTDLDLRAAAVVGTAGALTAWAATELVSRMRAPGAALAAALPHTLAAPVAYLLGRLLVG